MCNVVFLRVIHLCRSNIWVATITAAQEVADGQDGAVGPAGADGATGPVMWREGKEGKLQSLNEVIMALR